jgi:hypothetical protein
MSNMTAFLIQGLAGLMLVLFGAMALLPLFTSPRSDAGETHRPAEDRVLHVSPVPMIERLRPVAEMPMSLDRPAPQDDPSRRDAA